MKSSGVFRFKKRGALLLAAIGLSAAAGQAFALPFQWDWGLNISGYDSAGRAVATDPDGNIYVTGYFEGSYVSMNPLSGFSHPTSSHGGKDSLIVKYNSAGECEWAASWGGPEDDRGMAIAVYTDDPERSGVYVAGSFRDGAEFHDCCGEAWDPEGESDIFVVKLDLNGAHVWGRQIGGPEDESPKGIAVDGDGNCYVTGYFRGTADFDPGPGTFTLSSAGEMDAFVCKLDVSGAFVWAKRIGGSENDHGFGIAVDAGSGVYVAGYFSDYAYLGTSGLGIDKYGTSEGDRDVFVARMRQSDGSLRWARTAGSDDRDVAYGIAVDTGGNAYTTGVFSGDMDFDPGAGTAVLEAGDLGVETFVWKLDGNGHYEWARATAGEDDDNDRIGISKGRGIAVGPGGDNVYITGWFHGYEDFDPAGAEHWVYGPACGYFICTDTFVWCLDSSGGFNWVRTGGGGAVNDLGGTYSDAGYGVASGGLHVYVTGYFDNETAQYGGITLTSALGNGYRDAFLCTLSPLHHFIH